MLRTVNNSAEKFTVICIISTFSFLHLIRSSFQLFRLPLFTCHCPFWGMSTFSLWSASLFHTVHFVTPLLSLIESYLPSSSLITLWFSVSSSLHKACSFHLSIPLFLYSCVYIIGPRFHPLVSFSPSLFIFPLSPFCFLS